MVASSFNHFYGGAFPFTDESSALKSADKSEDITDKQLEAKRREALAELYDMLIEETVPECIDAQSKAIERLSEIRHPQAVCF